MRQLRTHVASKSHKSIQGVLLIRVLFCDAFVELNDMHKLRELYFFAPILVDL